MHAPSPTTVTTLAELETLYGEVGEASRVKETDRLIPEYRAWIEAAPFLVLATSGPEGLDCSPRGDVPGFVRVVDDRTLLIPDRRGNNRIDSLRNIVRDPRVALLFLVPGMGETLRVNGQAAISAVPDLLDSFSIDGKPPKSVLVVHVGAVFFQCSRAIVRSDLWNPERHMPRGSLPTAGQMLAAASGNRVGGDDYDRALPERVRATLY
ncbi:pyridoxamine 5'-phosphate oxidase family protein [Microvirga massiliensis]|uniref:pyridoxamine 5'-phosphate oxidase family protein n=1 Tax=Microvirga massiliensis TaxID=1033741 RepID=UPI00062B430C|nr:pyridoxamine 5'-phosphate oxidase family protein [Microvirga massiliensis]